MSKLSSSEYDEMRERFAEESYNINPNIKDFPQFVEALNQYLRGTAQGEGAHIGNIYPHNCLAICNEIEEKDD